MIILNTFCSLIFDGTLSPLVDQPADAQVLEGLDEVIQRCTEKIRVCIITGRDTEVIKKTPIV